GVARATTPPVESCGYGDGSDWLCLESGEVTVGRTPVRGSGPVRVLPRKRIWVGRAGSARVAFAQQALCRLGGVLPATKVVSRLRGSLFLQKSGATACESLLGQNLKFGYFCGRTGPCPVSVLVVGKILSEWRKNSSRVLAGLSRPLRKELVLSICSSAYRVTVGGRGKHGEASGYSSPPQQVIVKIVEVGDFGLEISSEPGGEACSLEV
ncbi:MAG TPA: hypothetical protein VGK43_06095, partial [Solirubrobacterales bacterium]